MVVTYGLIGNPPPSASKIPPTTLTIAKLIDNTGTQICDEESLSAAAAGVTSKLNTSSAPITCTAAATTRPKRIMKSQPMRFTFTPLAIATELSRDAKTSGLQKTAMAISTETEMAISQVTCGSSTVTI